MLTRYCWLECVGVCVLGRATEDFSDVFEQIQTDLFSHGLRFSWFIPGLRPTPLEREARRFAFFSASAGTIPSAEWLKSLAQPERLYSGG